MPKDLSFLDNTGVDKIEFAQVGNELELLAGEFIDAAQTNLNATNSNSSGKLSSSLEVLDPIINGTQTRIDITMNMYGQFVNKGVKGVVSGSGAYSFKNLFVSTQMISSLTNSKSKSKSKTSSTNTRKTISQNEKKNASISEISSVWGAAINIKKFGIKATGFIDKAIITTEQKVQEMIGNALIVDILTSMENI